MSIQLFDGHCDTLSRCLWGVTSPYGNGGSMRENTGHVELKRAHETFGGYAQFFAAFADSGDGTAEGCAGAFEKMFALFRREMAVNADLVTPCCTGEQAEQAMAGGRIAAFLSVEGGELLGCGLEELEDACRKGVRAVNITWNHANLLSGSCVEQSNRGLSRQGRAFVERMLELGMLVDVSHLSDPGFWDVCELAARAGKPFFASHSNSRALCAHPRNLTDEQFMALVAAGGVTGINLYTGFLGDNPGLEDAAAHIEHFCSLGGQANIAMGGDWDGCDLVPGLERVTDLPKLYELLLRRNFKESLVQDIFFHNLMRVVKQVCIM